MRTPVEHPEFLDQVRMLEETLRHHMAEEEQRMFPESHALGEDRLQELGRQLAERQQELYRSRVMRLMIRLKHTVLRLV